MKARIIFYGDPSVGIFASRYEMDLPFADRESLEDYGISECREQITNLYSQLCDGHVSVIFDFENFY